MGIEVTSAQAVAAVAASTGQTALLQDGQVVDALVLALKPNGQVLLALGGFTIEAALQTAGASGALAQELPARGAGESALLLTPGSRVPLQVTSGGGVAVPLRAPAEDAGGPPLVFRLLPSPLATAGAHELTPGVPAPGGGLPSPASGPAPVGQDTRIAAAHSLIRLAGAPLLPGEAHEIARGIVPEALSRQESHARLFATVAALLERPLPPSVKAAALALQGLRLPTDGTLAAPRLEAAIRGSGVFLENTLARAGRTAAPPQDLKAAVLALRQAVAAWPEASRVPPAGNGASIPVQPPSSQLRARPPLRGSLPVGQAPQDAGDIRAISDTEVAHLLSRETEAALARIELSQFASLEAQAEGSLPMPAQAERQWTFELPLALGNQTAVAQFQLVREWDGAVTVATEGERAWRVRFSVASMPEGPIDAQIVLRAGRVAVTLWAEREGTASTLNHELPELVAALEEAALVLNSVQVRHGRPVAPALPTGQLVDSRS